MLLNKKYNFSKIDILLIRQFVEDIDNDIIVRKSKVWEVDQETNMIYLGTKAPSKQNEYFYEWYSQQDFFIPIDITLISLLHEIGHIMKGYNEKMLEQRAKMNNMYNFLYEQGSITAKELNFAYFDIPEELTATKWGVDYYKSNKQKCEDLAEALGLYDLT